MCLQSCDLDVLAASNGAPDNAGNAIRGLTAAAPRTLHRCLLRSVCSVSAYTTTAGPARRTGAQEKPHAGSKRIYGDLSRYNPARNREPPPGPETPRAECTMPPPYTVAVLTGEWRRDEHIVPVAEPPHPLLSLDLNLWRLFACSLGHGCCQRSEL